MRPLKDEGTQFSEVAALGAAETGFRIEENTVISDTAQCAKGDTKRVRNSYSLLKQGIYLLWVSGEPFVRAF